MADALHPEAINLVRAGRRGGTPVVLVHPVGLDLTYWDAQIEALGAGFDIIAFDLPGHGRSPGTPAECRLDHLAAVLAGVVRSAGTSGAHVVGLSVGGMIAQALAMSEPGLVRSLVLMDTAASFPDSGREALRARAVATRDGGMDAMIPTTLERWFAAETFRRRPDLIERVTRTLSAQDPHVNAAMWEMIANLDLASGLHRIECPTLVLVGALDQSTPLALARAIRDGIPQAELHVVEGASHMAALESPAIVNRHISRFLGGLP